jgi:opacity protein-like surface antigen
MKKVILTLVLAFSFSQFVLADTRGEFQAGFILDGDPEISFAGVSDDLDVDTGINLGAAFWVDGVGSPNLSLGVSWNHTMDADYSESATGILFGAAVGLNLAIEHDIDAFMVNAVFRDNSSNSKMHPYLGGGVGFAKVDADVSAALTVNGQVFSAGAISDDDTPFAAQITGGFDYDISENAYLGVNATYFMTEATLFGADVEFDSFRVMATLGITF